MQTKWNAKDKGFALKNNLIIALVVAKILAEEDEQTPENVQNITEDGDTFDDTQIFATPEEVGRALIADWYKRNPPVQADASFKVDSTTVQVGATANAVPATPGGSFSSDNSSVATVTADGLITGVSEGNANITYTVANPNPTTETVVGITVVPAANAAL